MPELSKTSDRMLFSSLNTISQDRKQHLLSLYSLAVSSHQNCIQESEPPECTATLIYLSKHTQKKRIWQGEFGRSKMKVVRLIVTNARQLFSKGLEPRGLPLPLPLVPITDTQTAQREGG